MAYLVQHHGTFWFQIRVPRPLTARYGQLVRQNLQTTNHSVAQALAFQLAGQWLTRFATERMSSDGDILAPADSWPLGSSLPASIGSSLISARAVCPPSVDIMGAQASVRSHAEAQSGQEVADTMDGILRYWRKLNPDVREGTYKEFKSCVKEFKRTVHKRPADLQRSDIAKFRDKLINAGLAQATVAKRVGFISTLLQTAFDAGMLAQNSARGMRIPKPKIAEVKRHAFTADELRRIFTSPVYSKNVRPRGAGGEAAAWVPLIALATGARLEEVCQLRVADIYRDKDHGYLLRITDGEAGQTIKTTGSRRVVPLHPELVLAGLIEYWEEMQEEEQEWLFPELEPDHDGRRGGNWGKWFARYLRSRLGCGIADRQVVFHSFRHTFKTLCRDAGILEEVHDALTGHAGRTVGRTYGHMPLSALAVAGIRFPIVIPRVCCAD